MFLKYNWFGLLWALFVMTAHAIPGRELPKVSWDFLEFDKIVHFALFGILSFALGNGFNKQSQFYWIKQRYEAIIMSFCLLYALLLETLQFYIFVGRAFQVDDLIADLFGTVMGLVLLKVLYGRLLKLS